MIFLLLYEVKSVCIKADQKRENNVNNLTINSLAQIWRFSVFVGKV